MEQTGGLAVQLEGVRQDFDRLRGHLYEFIEAIGMPDRQQDAFKGIIRRESLNVQTRIELRLRGEDVE
jgi:hypothetical protein